MLTGYVTGQHGIVYYLNAEFNRLIARIIIEFANVFFDLKRTLANFFKAHTKMQQSEIY